MRAATVYKLLRRNPEILDVKRASWGGWLFLARCRWCDELCWFAGDRLVCDDCCVEDGGPPAVERPDPPRSEAQYHGE